MASRRHPTLFCAAACAWLLARAALAGEIAGAPVALPLTLNPDLYVQWGNDFFGRGGSQDDYRTQQSILNARIGERWLLALDYSILTVGAEISSTEPVRARLDQLSGSLGYVLYDHGGSLRRRLSAGLGVRATGDFDGDVVQNGFHRLSTGQNVQLPYVDSDEVIPIGWLQGGVQHALLETSVGWAGRWDLGYWASGTLLASTDGQLDGTAGLYAIAENGPWRIWTGPRGDLREGYSQDPVQSATARVEEGYFYVVGLSVGPLILQTAQALSADTQSFGSISISASEAAGLPIDNHRSALGVQVSLLIPDVQVNTQLRWSPASINAHLPERRRLYLIAGIRYGEPTYKDSPTAWVEVNQAVMQIELEGETVALGPWIKPYASFGFGLRDEQLADTASGTTLRSRTVQSGVAVADAGVRFDAAGDRGRWGLQVKLGLSGWLPFSSEDVEVNGTRYSLQEPGLAMSAGVTASYSW
ncbi:MAG: hypothetical protein R3286_11730 [Gammaproteobacteria bacterium]|nr:hypothetical protein [Gammaproteobacteria bacterium]